MESTIHVVPRSCLVMKFGHFLVYPVAHHIKDILTHSILFHIFHSQITHKVIHSIMSLQEAK
jgi:hypothetical protein